MNSTKLKQFGIALHLVAAICSLLILAVMYGAAYRMLDVEIREASEQTKAKQHFLATASSISSTHAELQQHLANEEARLKALLERIPPTPQESDFLAQLSRLARECDLSIQKFSRGAATDEETHAGMEVKLSATASHSSICRFLAGLADLRRLCHVRQLSVQAPAELGNDYPIESTLRIFFAPLHKTAANL